MSQQLETFQASYSAALDRHLAGGGETGLELAYELGREAVTSGLSLLELAGIHHAALSRSLERAAGPADLERIAGLGGDFFLESLSTFEMTQRGFLEVQEKARLEQRHADQLRGLADAALAVNSTLSVDEMLELVAERARALVGARRSSVSIAAENGDAPLGSGRDADHLSAPLIDREGRPLGSIWLADKREGSFSDDDESILVQLAQMASVAIANARLYEREKGIAVALQENLLPAGLPDIPGVITAAHYRAGAEGVDVGGDWYEVIPLPGGRVGMAIGDVVGRGVRAAAMMGQLRVALRAYAMELGSPAAVAGRVARFVRTLDSEQMGTCVYAVLDPRSGELRFTIAGHPPPLVLSADGEASFLDGTPGLPFGVRSDSDYSESSVTVAPGSTLLLYTDGLVERRGEPIDHGLERLRGLAAGTPTDPDSLCDRVLDAAPGGGASRRCCAAGRSHGGARPGVAGAGAGGRRRRARRAAPAPAGLARRRGGRPPGDPGHRSGHLRGRGQRRGARLRAGRGLVHGQRAHRRRRGDHRRPRPRYLAYAARPEARPRLGRDARDDGQGRGGHRRGRD